MRKLIALVLCQVMVMQFSFAQGRTITGKVSDANGEGVSNASIIIKGTTTGTTSRQDGSYSISVPSTARILVISAVGYETMETSIENKTVINVKLNVSVAGMEEVVVTGFGVKKRAEFAGAATKVNADQIKTMTGGSFENLLQGKAPGLTVLSGSGQPGASSNVVLRGLSSITGGSTPLYIMDGIPVEAAVFQAINPQDIESVDVLKDASASALYGSRGATGVIVVTTKRGQAGKARIGYSGQSGQTKAPRFNWAMANAKELLQLQEDYGLFVPTTATSAALPGWIFSRKNPANFNLSAAQLDALDKQRDSVLRIGTNWDDVFFRTGTFNRHDISVSGGNGGTRYFSQFGYYDEQGIGLRTDMKRYTWRNNIDYTDNKLTVGISNLASFVKRNFQESSVTNSTLNPFLVTRIAPATMRLRDDFGNLITGIGNRFAAGNLYENYQYNLNYNDQFKLVTSADLKYKITKNLTAGGLIGVDFRETQGTTYMDPRSARARNTTDVRLRTGFITESLSRNYSFNTRGNMTYRKVIADRHNVELTGLGEFFVERFKSLSMTGYGIDFRRPNTFAGITPFSQANLLNADVSGSRSQRAIGSVAGLGKYSYDGKYTVNVSYRYDGSSQLPTANRWKGFYSVGAIWEASKENFIADIKQINTLRLRSSYGTSANANNFPFGDFGYLAAFGSSTYNGVQTITPTNPGNSDANWEFTKQLNIGLDFSFFNRRLHGSLDVYDKRTENAFANQTLSFTGGFSSLSVNSSTVGNKGIEWMVNGDVVRNNNLKWTLNVNGSYNKNEVLDLGKIATFTLGTSQITKGLPLGSHFEVGWAGVDRNSGKPLYYDTLGNVMDFYSAAQKVQKWGTWFAPYAGGFGTDFSYKGFDLNAAFNYQVGSTRVNNLEFFVENPNGFLAGGWNQSATMKMWTKPGDNATVQSPLYGKNFSSQLIQKADFLRFRSLTIGYTAPSAIIKNIKHITGFRFFVAGQNIYYWSSWKGYDPEDDNNISLSEFPNPRTYTAGIEIKF